MTQLDMRDEYVHKSTLETYQGLSSVLWTCGVCSHIKLHQAHLFNGGYRLYITCVVIGMYCIDRYAYTTLYDRSGVLDTTLYDWSCVLYTTLYD
jgi:hypothetical protein